MSLRSRCRKIFAFFQCHKYATVREAAKATGMSKSSVHRYKQTLASRNQHPESWLWETEEGYRWLVLLVCATIYVFGIRGGMGVGTLAEFFLLVRLEKHIGVSATSLHRLVGRIEEIILAYRQKYEQAREGVAHVVVGADETFFEQVVLVMIELSSGYILLEEPAEDRTFVTWKAKALHALQNLGLTVRYMVSDNAKALTKLALDGLLCRRIPDLFHASHELVKLLGTRFASKAARLQRQLSKALVTLNLLKHMATSPEKIQAQEQRITDLTREQNWILEGQRRYYESLRNLSKAVHPFSVPQQASQSSQEAEEQLNQILDILHTLSEEYAITDAQNRIAKVRKQIADIVAVIDVWWAWVRESLPCSWLSADLESWLLEYLLPMRYWQVQGRRTAASELHQVYQTAFRQAQHRFQSHPLTAVLHPKELARWQSWAHWMVMKFQRTSSAVEGRNGVLSRMNHNQRSISTRRLNVLTVVHNFGIRREDGTTAAERLFQDTFPDLFDWIVKHVGELPRPRDRLALSS